MKANELAQYIFKGRHPFFASRFAHWIESSRQFGIFVENDRNQNKILARVRNAKTDADFRDVWFEFGMAYLMLKNGRFLEVEYEKYKKENKRGPDFTVTYETGTVFNVEVRRIRKPPKSQERFEKWEEDIVKQIPSVPSTLAVGIWIEHIDEFDPSRDLLERLLERLEDRTSDIINYITSTISEAEKDTSIDGVKRYSVPGFKGEVELVFSKPSSKPTRTLSYYGVSSYPALRTHREYYKFGDVICEKLGQMRPSEINVLAVITDSDTHDDFDFGEAIARLNELVELKDDTFFKSKGFAGTDDFLEQFKRLGGVFLRGPWGIIPTNGADTPNYPNGLWCNEEADRQIPEDICEALRRMD